MLRPADICVLQRPLCISRHDQELKQGGHEPLLDLSIRVGREGTGRRARHYVASERMMAYQVNARIAWYRSLWARRTELTNALYARMMNLPRLDVAQPAQAAYELRPLP